MAFTHTIVAYFPSHTEADHDEGTSDLLTSDVLRTNESQVWFIAEHLVDTPLVRS